MLAAILLTKCYSRDQIQKNEIGGHVARMGNIRRAQKFLVGYLWERHHSRWEDNNKMDLEGVEWGH
jgi:hypothetical protein